MQYFFSKWKSDSAKNYYSSLLFRLRKSFLCVKNTFKSWPPNKLLSPIEDKDKEKITEMCIYLDAFIINCYAICDNIAHIWNEEVLNIKEKEKFENKFNIGIIGDRTKEFRETLPKEFFKILEEFKEFLNLLKRFRNALSHRDSPQVEENDTYLLKLRYSGWDDESLKFMLGEYRVAYFSEILKLSKNKKNNDFNEEYKKINKKYRKEFQVRPILNFYSTEEITKTNRFRNSKGHEYVHSYMLETFEGIIFISSIFFKELIPYLDMSKDNKKMLKESCQLMRSKISKMKKEIN